MSIQTQFDKFYENIKLTSAQTEDAITKHIEVCKKLHNYYYPGTVYNGNTSFLIGSYKKHTHIRPTQDVDVIFILPPEKFAQYDDNESNKQGQLLQDVKSILEERYPNTPISAFGKIVKVEFAEDKHDIELVPAWENNDGTFTIPNSENKGSWDVQDYRQEISDINDSDKQTGKTRFLIRCIKKWSRGCSVKSKSLKSFNIDQSVLNFLSFFDYSGKEDSILVKEFFNYFCQTILDETAKSCTNTALNRAIKACSFENENNLEKATEEWKKIFGNDFPWNNKNIDISKEDIILLGDYSHCKPLCWVMDLANKVNIKTRIYGDEKQKIDFGGINSDGRNLSIDLFLKFTAQTDASGDFQYYWQVVNTGEEARVAIKKDGSVGDLRGDFILDGQTHKEHTRYRGKHWVECFVVQNNICVARSGKFFINIK